MHRNLFNPSQIVQSPYDKYSAVNKIHVHDSVLLWTWIIISFIIGTVFTLLAMNMIGHEISAKQIKKARTACENNHTISRYELDMFSARVVCRNGAIFEL